MFFMVNMAFLGVAVQAFRAGGLEPRFLLLSEERFRELVLTAALRPELVPNLKKMGIEKVVWSYDLGRDQICLSTGKGISDDVETLVLK